MSPPEAPGHYLALGDSISIDLYPGLDAAEREGLAAPPAGLGAASLFHANDDVRWPDFEDRDLTSRVPGLPATNLCQDGATLRWVVGLQLPRIPDDLEGPVLVTLTVGGNDLLHLLEAPPGPGGEGPLAAGGPRDADDVADGVERILDILRGRLPAPTFVVGTVYDPSDGTGALPGTGPIPGAVEALEAFNGRVRALGAAGDVEVADVHDHFLGHGLSEPDPRERWYWPHSIIEPSARGASEVRRLFLEAVGM
jgi:lysophospholipase L1-like esterase